MTDFEHYNEKGYTEMGQEEIPVPGKPSDTDDAEKLAMKDSNVTKNDGPGQNETQDNGPWNQNPNPWDNGQFQNGPQNQGPWNQNPNPWDNGQFQNGPQNQGPWNQNPNPWNNGQFQNGPQNQGPWNQNPRPYKNPYNPYGQKPKKNSYATYSLITGIFAVLMLCCFTFTSAITMGVGAISLAVISKKDEPFTKTAITAIVLGIFAIIGGFAEFAYSLWLSDLMKDPANAAIFNQILEQFQQEMGGTVGNMIP